MTQEKNDLDWTNGEVKSYTKWPRGMCKLISAYNLSTAEIALIALLLERYPHGDLTDGQIGNELNLNAKTVARVLSSLLEVGFIEIFKKTKHSGLSLKVISIAPLRKLVVKVQETQLLEKERARKALKEREDKAVAPPLPEAFISKNRTTSEAELVDKFRKHSEKTKAKHSLPKEILDIASISVDIKQNFRENVLKEGAVRFPTWRATRGECNLEAKLDELIRYRLTLPQFAQLGQHSEGFWGLIGEQLQNFADEKAKEMQIDFKHFYRDLNRAYDKYMNSLDDNAELLTMTEFHDGVIAGANYKWFDDITDYLPRKSLSEVELQERQTANGIEELLNANRQKSSDKEDLSNKDAATAWLFEDESKTS